MPLRDYWELQTREWTYSSLRVRSLEEFKYISRARIDWSVFYDSLPSYDMQGEWVYYNPDPPWVLFYIDIRPEAGYTFASFGGSCMFYSR